MLLSGSLLPDLGLIVWKQASDRMVDPIPVKRLQDGRGMLRYAVWRGKADGFNLYTSNLPRIVLRGCSG